MQSEVDSRPAGSPDDPGRAALAKAIGTLVTAGAAGVQIRVNDGRGEWVGTAGVAERGSSRPVPPDGRFRIGSVTKTYVAAVLLLLAGDGELSLDDPVSRYLPRFGLDERITVRMILMHVSGVFDFSGEHGLDETSDCGIFPTSGETYVKDLESTYEPDELVRFSLAKPARFAPGATFGYSNTNYILAGLLIEKVTGAGYAQQVHDRIVAPLGLTETSVPGRRTAIPGPHAHGYLGYRDAGTWKVADVTRYNPSRYWAAGEIISTTRDVDAFLLALLDGRLLPPPLLAEMTSFIPPGSGLGVSTGLFRREFTPGHTGIGHFGSVPGYLCSAYSTVDGGVRLVMSVTKGAVDRFDPVAFSRFQRAVDATLVACFSSLVPPGSKRAPGGLPDGRLRGPAGLLPLPR
ncbi:MAG: beta-lactamase family protein [Micromonosporaceae bacterium]|nr:beta-lactamase family protein [Micromonosporaceae bacterium]